MRKRNLILCVPPVAAFALLFFATKQPVLHAATGTSTTNAAATVTTSAPIPTNAAQQATREIIFGNLKPYNHKSGWFGVSFPENWTINDKSTPDEAVLLVADPTENGVVVIRVYASKDYPQPELGTVLKNFVHDKMSALENFTIGDPTPQKDGTSNVVFHYSQPQDGQEIRMYGEGFIQQRNGFLGIIVLLLPQEQYDAKSKSAYEITDSFHVTGKK
jgi:hypothetical protein